MCGNVRTTGLFLLEPAMIVKKIIKKAKRSYQNQVHDRLVSESIGSRDFWHIYRSFSNKGKSLIPPLFNSPEILMSAASRAELFVYSTLQDTGHVLPEIQPRTDVNYLLST